MLGGGRPRQSGPAVRSYSAAFGPFTATAPMRL